mmetsp:Transcript_14918/g.19445  ORF Transcript_14918/g.19445 Transcript_14918/m.19445 type:complete len:262 (-) Transcript_14918:797-1582(-)
MDHQECDRGRIEGQRHIPLHQQPLKEGKCVVESSTQKMSASGDCRFYCNICLDTVQEPVVTQCGHLFCWTCLYRWLVLTPPRGGGNSEESNLSQLRNPLSLFGNSVQEIVLSGNPTERKVCPVCKAECSINTVIPLYVREQNFVSKCPCPATTRSKNVSYQSDVSKFSGSSGTIPDGDCEIRVPSRPSNRSAFLQPVNSNQSRRRLQQHRYISIEERSALRPVRRYSANEDIFEDDVETRFLSRLLVLLGIFVVSCFCYFE